MTKNKTEIKKILLSTLKENPKNPRKIDDEVLERLCKSLKRFPKMLEKRPIVIDENKMVLGGNQRLIALKKLGYKEIPENWVADASDWSEQEKKEFIIKDNISYGFWNEDILKTEFDVFELEEFDFDLEMDVDFGGDDEEEPQEDECPALKKESIVKMGDLWTLGSHRLKCGDSTKKEDVEDLMSGEKANISFTSPPYNAGVEVKIKNARQRYNSYDDDNKNYPKLLNDFTNLSLSFCEMSIINIQQLATNKIDIIDWLYNFKNNFVDMGIWNKTYGVPALAKNVLNCAFEYIVFLKKENNPTRSISTAKQFKGIFQNIFDISKQKNNEFSDIHRATFPVALPFFIIKSFSTGSVLDLFGGTRTTLIACEQLNRKCYMQELDELYCQVIIDRYIKFKQNKGEDVFLLKDGKKIPYKEIIKNGTKTN